MGCALLRELPAYGKSRCAPGLARRRIARGAGVAARVTLGGCGAVPFVSSRRAMRVVRARHYAGFAARFHRRRALRMNAANRKGCEKDAEDYLAAHEGECEQSRAPLVYVDPRVRQSVF
jgi:hypothetical protein